MWTSDINSNDLIGSFATLLEKDVPSKGGFEADFDAYINQYGAVKCPAVNFDSSSNTLRVVNAAIDLTNWRAVLLAMCTVGSVVKNIFIHNCSLDAQHIAELAAALCKSGSIKSLRIQYAIFEVNEDNKLKFIESFKNLLQDSTQLEYLSLKGNQLGDDLVVTMFQALSTNFRLSSLNLAANNLSDAVVDSVIQSLRLLGTFRALSLANNNISANGVSQLLNLLVGAPSTPKDEADLKAQTKIIADKNKAIKDVNKKRKKAGLPEFIEFPPSGDCVRTVEGKPIVVNANISVVDIARNQLSTGDLQQLLIALKETKGLPLSDVSAKVYLTITDDWSSNPDIQQQLADGIPLFVIV